MLGSYWPRDENADCYNGKHCKCNIKHFLSISEMSMVSAATNALLLPTEQMFLKDI
jgi:hypothetical protein